MKKVFFIFLVSAILTSCGSSSVEPTSVDSPASSVVDTLKQDTIVAEEVVTVDTVMSN